MVVRNDNVAEMVARLQSGDLRDFPCLVRRYQNTGFGYALSIVGDFDDAEDATQEGFVEVYRNLPSLREPAAFAGWLRTIVRAQCHRVLRRRIPMSPLDIAVDVASAGPNPESACIRGDEEQRLLRAVNELSEPLRQMIVLHYLEDNTIADIADFLQVPVSVVKNRLYRGRKTLKRRMIPMDTTFKKHALTDDFAKRIGEVILARGPIIEARFSPDQTPAPLTRLAVDGQPGVVVQVIQRVEDGLVRAVVYSQANSVRQGENVRPVSDASLPIPQHALRAAIDAARSTSVEMRMIETGIKVIDLFCPLIADGTAGFFGDAGAGKAAVIQEIVNRLTPRNEAAKLFAFAENVDEARLIANMSDPIPDGAAYIPVSDASVSGNAEVLASLDVVVNFSSEMAAVGQWPAIDPLTVRSAYLDNGSATDYHRAVVDRACLTLSSTSPNDVTKARKLRSFLTQSLSVATPHTGVPGEYLPLVDTLAAVEELLSS